MNHTPAGLSAVIRRINRKLLSTAPFEEVFDFVFESVEAVIPFDRMGIALVAGDRLQSHWIRSKQPATHLRKGYSARIEGSSLQEVLATGRPRTIDDLKVYLEAHPSSESTRLVLADGIRSSLTCPLYADGQAAGFIFFSSCEPHTYAQRHTEIFEDLAMELSLAVQKERLQCGFDANADKDRIMSTVLHDLKSPLGVMQGFLEAIKEEEWFVNLDRRSLQIFQILARNCTQMQKLVSDLKEVGGLSRQDSNLACEEILLKEYISGVQRGAALMAAVKGISLQALLDPSLPEFVRFDAVRIKQVLDNLLTNAFKFSPPDSKVTLSIHADMNRLTFSITDQGPGIPLSEQSKLFQEFGKTSVRPTAGEDSTGLGLFISRQLVEQHGGPLIARE